jgi:pimeloyl-ACP methyl ester carboxylesterase
VSWAACALDSNKASGSDAECADVTVPVDWSSPDGPTLTVFVKRWPVLKTPAAHHVWLLQGGPGYSSAEWDGKVKGPHQSFPEAQFYLRDPRGTGRSTRLGCEAEEDPKSDGGIDVTMAEWPSCLASVKAEQGATLPFFTTTQTAKDLGELIEATRGAATKITVLGQSYGTTLVERWLHFYPHQTDAVILDSIANPGSTFTRFSEGVDRVGHDYLGLCAKDAACVAKLGADPKSAADQAFSAAFDKGGCPQLVAAGVDRAALASDLFSLLTFAAYRPMIPPVIHRLARCNAGDVAALSAFHGAFAAGAPSIVDRLFSPVLHHHIVLSEMWDAAPPSPAAHLASLQSLDFGLLDVELDTLWATWPKYQADAFAAAYPTTTVPLLMMNGTLDAQTPLAEAKDAETHFTAANQAFFEVPGAPHGAIGGEPWSQPSPPCSVQIVTSFVTHPDAPIDASCFGLVDPIAFEPDAATTQLFFGVPDPWGDAPPPAPPTPTKGAPRPSGLRRSRTW